METRTSFGLQMDTATHRTCFVLGSGARPATAAAALRGTGTLTEVEVQRLLAARARGEDGLGPVRIASADFGGMALAVFTADGRARDGGFVELRCGGTWLRVRVQVGTGRVTVTAP
jgi:phage tail sheath gpL-like